MPLRSWSRYRGRERASAPPGGCSSMMSQWPRIAVERPTANQMSCLFVGSRFPLICVGHVQRALLELQFDNSKLWIIIQSTHRPPSPPTASRRNGFQAARTELPAELALPRRHQQRQGIEGVTLDKRPCDTRLLRLQDREHHPQQRLHGMSGSIRDARTAIDPSAQIATEHSPWAQTSTVGVWIDAGSRAETDKTNGTAHFLEHLAFKVRRDA
jgi:hypothetical protein